MTHWLKPDYRIDSLQITIDGLEQSMKFASKLSPDIYDVEEYYEFLLGLEMQAFHHYISMSCRDIFNIFDFSSKPKINYPQTFYMDSEKVTNSEYSKIEFIVALATYFKHRDDEKLKDKKHKIILDSFNLLPDTNWEMYWAYYPVSKGYEILNPSFEINNLIELVGNWRMSLWDKYEAEFLL